MSIEKRLVEEVRKHKILYDMQSSGYRNIALKSKLWKEIGEQLKLTDGECMKKWKYLRDRYRKEVQLKKLPSGSSGSSNRTWELYESMQFLSDHCKPRRAKRNAALSKTQELFVNNNQFSQMSEDEEDEPEETVLGQRPTFVLPDSPPENVPDCPADLLEKLNAIHRQFLIMVRSFEERFLCSQLSPRINGEDDEFGQTIANMLRLLQSNNKKIAKANILTYLAKMQIYELGCLSERTTPSLIN